MLVVTLALLTACITLGGATSSGFLSDVALQLFSVPALLLALWSMLERRPAEPVGAVAGIARKRFEPRDVVPLAIVACMLLILLGQYFPILGGPGIDGVLKRLGEAGATAEPATLWTGAGSLDLAASRAALAAALPTIAIFLLTRQLDLPQRIRLLGWMACLGLMSLAIGILQVMQGPTSPLRFFEISNEVEAIGFFANRNHFAALLLTTLIYGIAWWILQNKDLLAQRRDISRKITHFAGFFCFVFVMVGGVALARSRAGILLTIAALIALATMAPTFMVVLRGREHKQRRLRSLSLIAAAILLVAIGQLGSARFLTRFDEGVTDKIRATLREVTLQASVDALPAGTGLATFPSVYAVYEDNRTLSGATYVNRAHNDWLEFALEAGLPGIALLMLFLMWYGCRVRAIWSSSDGQSPALLVVQRAASLTVLLTMVHSLVDYPLRTAAIAACFAVGCALMAQPPALRTPGIK